MYETSGKYLEALAGLDVSWRPVFAFGYNACMRILFERTGGFAAIKLERVFDSTTLSPDEASQLESLVQKSSFFDLPLQLKTSGPGYDRFHYKLTVETDQGSRTVEASESAVPSSMRPLLHWLETRKP